VRGGLIPKRQIIGSAIHFLARDERNTRAGPRRYYPHHYSSSVAEGHVSISHALVMMVTSRKGTSVVDMRNHNP